MALYYHEDLVPVMHIYSIPTRTPIYVDYYLADEDINYRRKRPIHRSFDLWTDLSKRRKWLVGIPPDVLFLDDVVPYRRFCVSRPPRSPYVTSRVKRFCTEEVLIYTGPCRVVAIPGIHRYCPTTFCLHLDIGDANPQCHDIPDDRTFVVEEQKDCGVVLRCIDEKKGVRQNRSALLRIELEKGKIKYNWPAGTCVKIIYGKRGKENKIPTPPPDPRPKSRSLSVKVNIRIPPSPPQSPCPQQPEPKPPSPKCSESQTPEPRQPSPVCPETQTPEPRQPSPVCPEPETPEPRQPSPVCPETQTPEPRQPSPVCPESQTPEPLHLLELRNREVKLHEYEEVLAQWEDDKWYCRGTVLSSCDHNCYQVRDFMGRVEMVWRENIIRLRDNYSADPSSERKVCGGQKEYVVAPHPVYPWSYAPGCVIGKKWDKLTILFYDDRIGEDISAWRVYPALSPEKHVHDVNVIVHREKEWIKETAVIRDDSTGFYKLGELLEQIRKEQKYRVKWHDGKYTEQLSIHIYGKFTGQNKFSAGSYILACVDKSKIYFLPGKVKRIVDGHLEVEFINGKYGHHIQASESYLMNETFYKDSKELFLKRNPERTSDSD